MNEDSTRFMREIWGAEDNGPDAAIWWQVTKVISRGGRTSVVDYILGRPEASIMLEAMSLSHPDGTPVFKNLANAQRAAQTPDPKTTEVIKETPQQEARRKRAEFRRWMAGHGDAE